MYLAEDRFKCELIREQTEDKEWKLTGSRIATKACRNPDHILITLPQIGICQRTLKVTMTTVKIRGIWFRNDTDQIKYDHVEWNTEEDRYDFYYDDELAAWVKCECFRIMGEKEEEAHGPEYRLASIRFHKNGRNYDYICDDTDVNVGDHVIVMGYDGETEVEVTGVRFKRESELGLPVEKYKKVIRKADLLTM